MSVRVAEVWWCQYNGMFLEERTSFEAKLAPADADLSLLGLMCALCL